MSKGFIAGKTINSKLLLKRPWKVNVDWNEVIPKDIYVKWYEWYKNLEIVKGLRLPRGYHLNFINATIEVQLHIIFDVSEKAYSV